MLNFQVKLDYANITRQIEEIKCKIISAKDNILNKTAEEMKDDVVNNAPYRSGALKNAMGVRHTNSELRSVSCVGDLEGNAPYAKNIEEARPFLGPAFDKHIKVLTARFKDLLEKIK